MSADEWSQAEIRMTGVNKFISAALIVRDEESFLGPCLRSIRELVDEIVVVDTGSTDHSREIATAHGARVFDYAWQRDFAAARNHAIEQAVGDWILYIDADERVRRYNRRTLRSELSDPLLCAATVRFYPRSGFTAYREHRLFRRDPRIRFRGVIHETILPDLDRLAATGEGERAWSGLTIDHFGYDGDQRRKTLRNLPLLEHEIRVIPYRVYLWWHLGTVYRDLGRLAEAEASWLAGVEIAHRIDKRQPEDALCFIELAKLLFSKGEDPLPLIREALAMHPGNLMLEWLTARAFAAAGNYAEAIPIFERLAEIHAGTLLSDTAYDKRILGADALAEAGYWMFQTGRYRESEIWYRRAETRAPDRVEFRIKRELAGKRAARQHAADGSPR